MDYIVKDLRGNLVAVDTIDWTMKWHGKGSRSMLNATKVIEHPAYPKCCSLSVSTLSVSEIGSGTIVQSKGVVKVLMEHDGWATGVWVKIVGLVKAEAE